MFGQAAVAAMIKEFTQLNEGTVPGKPVVISTDARTLAVDEKKKALPAVNLIKENGEVNSKEGLVLMVANKGGTLNQMKL